MALAPTLHEVVLSLHHVDRAIDRELSVRLARHPSETLERLWLKILAYCWQWQEGLTFGPGLSDPELPDLEARDLTGQPTLWLRVGKADPGKVKRARDRNPTARVVVLFESPQRLEAFVKEGAEGGLARLELAAVAPELLRELSAWDERRLRITVTFVGDHFYLEKDGMSLDGPLTRAAV